jgi:predicted metal-dependent peptidase
MTPAEVAIRDARAKLAYVLPYFSHAAYALVLYETPDCPTIAVDRWRRLYFNPRFVQQLDVDQLTTVLFHEVSHVLRDHCARTEMMGVDHGPLADLANICQDCEINDDIRDAISGSYAYPEPLRMVPLPSWTTESGQKAHPWLADAIGQPDGKTWEEYFLALVQGGCSIQHDGDATPLRLPGGDDDAQKTPTLVMRHDCGSGAHGKRRPWEHGSPQESPEAYCVSDADWADVQERVAQSMQEAESRRPGSVPGGWVRWADATLRPDPIPWEDILAGQLRNVISMASGMVTHTWTRPSRRSHAVPDFALPHMRRPLPHLVVIGDTSGSMSDEDLAAVRGVVDDVCESLGVRPTFMAVDTNASAPQEVSGGADLRFEGGGGTDMRVGIDAAMSEPRLPDAIVIITDCETPWPAHPTPVPLLVCDVTNSHKPLVPSWAEYIGVSIRGDQS